MATTAVSGRTGEFLMEPSDCLTEMMSYLLRLYVKMTVLSFFFKFKSPESHSKASSTPTSFTALMKAAYSQGPSAFLEDAFRKSVGETLASMSMADFPVAIKQILLYIKSTVENLGTVGAQNRLTTQYSITLLNMYTSHHILPHSSPKT